MSHPMEDVLADERGRQIEEYLNKIDDGLESVEKIAQMIRELDIECDDFAEKLQRPSSNGFQDSIDHLKQIHFRLTECKGHLNVIKFELKRKQQ